MKDQILHKHFTNKTGKVQGYSLNEVRTAVKRVKYKAEAKDYQVIKVESKRLMNAMRVLNSHNIPYEVPENFYLEEKYESKL